VGVCVFFFSPSFLTFPVTKIKMKEKEKKKKNRERERERKRDVKNMGSC
jgi:uncharacterized membrane protein